MTTMESPTVSGAVSGAEPQKPAFFEDAKGRMIPARLVRDSDLLEDQFVRKLMSEAEALSDTMRAFKRMVFSDVEAFVALMHEKYDVKVGGKRGNMTFNSFDGRQQIKVQVADHMRFGNELHVAKALIDECITEWAVDSNDNIRALVEHAFRTDKEGKVNRESVLALPKLAIADERWERAMRAIADSITVESTSVYVRFYRRDSQDQPWKSVNLDLANV